MDFIKSKLEEGEFQEVIQLATKESDANSNLLQCFYLRAMAHRKLDDLKSSLKDFDSAIAIKDNISDIYSERGVTKFHLKDLDGALADLNRAQSLEPENPYRYSSRAYIKNALRDIDGAIEDYKKALEIDPEDMVAHNNLGMLEEKRGRGDIAKKHYDKAEKLSTEAGLDFYTQRKVTGDEPVREKIKNHREPVEPQKETTIFEAMKKVFTDKQEFKSFLKFIKTDILKIKN